MPHDILYYISPPHWFFIRFPKKLLSWQAWYTFPFVEHRIHEFCTCTYSFSTLEETKHYMHTACGAPCKLDKTNDGEGLEGPAVWFSMHKDGDESSISCRPRSARLLQDNFVEIAYEFRKDNLLLNSVAIDKQTFVQGDINACQRS